MTLPELLSHFNGYHRTGDGYRVNCPAHDDHVPSLSLIKKDDKILLHCHAGCKTASIMAALGLAMSDLFVDGKTGGNRRPKLIISELAASKKLSVEFLKTFGLKDTTDGVLIPYCLADGSPASRQRVRSHLEHVKGWCWWTSGDGTIVPYGLNRLADARGAAYVVLVEGESDLWTLCYHGFPALGIPGAEMAKTLSREHLQGISNIFILKEADTGGATFLANVTPRLQDIGWIGEIRIVSLAPHKDVNELHCADLAKFKAAFQAALDSAQRPAKPANSNGFTLTPLGELLAKPDRPVDYVVENILVAGTPSALVSKPKVGKSTLARNLCLAVSRGNDFLGLKTKQGECIYLALEEREEDVRNDFRAMGADGTEPILIHAAAAPAEGIQALCDLVKERKPRLVVIDPLFRLARVQNESAYAEIYAALGPLIDVSRETGTHVMVLHHSGKGIGKADPIDSPLGSTAIGGSVSTLVVLKRTESFRTIQTVQRIPEAMPETLLHFDSETRRLSIGGTRFEADRNECEAAIMEFLRGAAEPQTQAQVRDGVEGQTKVIRAALTALVEGKRVLKTGDGTKGKPFLYEFQNDGSQVYARTRKPESEKTAQSRMNSESMLVPEKSGKAILVPDTEEGQI
jgi:AAA domain